MSEYEIVVPEKPLRVENIVCEELEDMGAYIYINEKSGATLPLNPTASAVFDMCDGQTTAEAMAQVLSETLEVSHEEAIRDVEGILAELAGFGFFQN